MTLGLALTMGIGVAAGFGGHKTAQVAKAEIIPTSSDYYLAGSMTNWQDGTRLSIDSEKEDRGMLLNFFMTKGETFQFKPAGEDGWLSAIDFRDLEGGSAKNAFIEGEENCNIEVAVTGTYNFYIASWGGLYIEFAQTATIYVQIKDWSNTYVYSYDETTEPGVTLKSFGEFPGRKFNAGECTAETNFGGTTHGNYGGIAKLDVPYHTLANTKIIVNKGYGGEGNQSGNQDLYNGYYYYNFGNVGDLDYGKQAAVVYDVEKAILNTEHDSVCEIEKGTATTLVAEYDALALSSQFDASTMRTWNKAVNDDKINHTYEEIIEELREIASSADTGMLLSKLESNSSSIVIIAVLGSTIALVGLSGFFFIRKRKESI